MFPVLRTSQRQQRGVNSAKGFLCCLSEGLEEKNAENWNLNKTVPWVEEQSCSGAVAQAEARHSRAAMNVLLIKLLSWLSPGCSR